MKKIITSKLLSQLDPINFYREYGYDITKKGNHHCCLPGHEDRHPSLSIDLKRGMFNCFGCGNKGGMIQWYMAFHQVDYNTAIKEVSNKFNIQPEFEEKKDKFNSRLVDICHDELPEEVRLRLNDRGIRDEVINESKLGWWNHAGKDWLTIPIKNEQGKYIGFVLRREAESGNSEFLTYPSGMSAQLYDYEILQECEEVTICEGFTDCFLARSKGIYAVTSTHGAGTFKPEWIKHFSHLKRINNLYDRDKAGTDGAEKVLSLLSVLEEVKLYRIVLPDEVGEGGDLTDYLLKLKGNTDDLFTKYAKEYPEKIDTSNFQELSNKDLLKILGLTIKHDEVNKLITLHGELLTYTEDSQLNISFSAPSSTGKSYIPTEIAQLFPDKDVLEVGYCSPTAFFHDSGTYEKETNTIRVNLSRKIVIFLDQPHTQLLQHLRPLLSHDKKEILVKITDKSQKAGHRTKNVLLIGYPTVIFCTAGLSIDEQESTRFILLSPETNIEKIRAGVNEKIDKEADKTAYKKWLDENPQRILLKNRILAIKQEKIKDIKIGNPKKLKELFFNKYGNTLKPRHQRDIGKIISLIKGRTLLNLWFREKEGLTLITSNDDIEQGFNLWCEVSESQELNLPPFVYKLYQEVIFPAYEEAGRGISRNEVLKKHSEIYGRPLQEKTFRLEIIPMLENAGLIYQEKDKEDNRKLLIYPTTQGTISKAENNSTNAGGVIDMDSLFEPVKKKEE